MEGREVSTGKCERTGKERRREERKQNRRRERTEEICDLRGHYRRQHLIHMKSHSIPWNVLRNILRSICLPLYSTIP